MKYIYVKSYIGSSSAFSFYEKTEKKLVAIKSKQIEEGHWLKSHLRNLIGSTIFSISNPENGNSEFYLRLNTGLYKIYSDSLGVVQFNIDNMVGKKIIDVQSDAHILGEYSLDIYDYSVIARLLFQTNDGDFPIIFQGFSLNFGVQPNHTIHVSQYVTSENLWKSYK